MKQSLFTRLAALSSAILLCSLSSSGVARAQPQDPLIIVTGFNSGNVVALHPESGGWVELVIMTPDTPPGTGDRPRGVAIGPNYLIYVSLRGGDQNVKRYWWDGNFIDDFIPSFGGPLGPGQIEFTESGDLIVAGDEQLDSSVLRYNGTTGQLLDHFRVEGFTNIVGLALNEPYVYAGTAQIAVLRFDLSQTPVSGAPFIACCGTRPIGMSMSHRGTVLVSDLFASLVQEFDATTGQFIATFADLTSYGVTGILDVVYDSSRLRYYIASGQDRVLALDHSGTVTNIFRTDLLSGAYALTIATPPVPIAVAESYAPQLASGVRVSPNPGSGPFTIDMDAPPLSDHPSDLHIYDSTGRLVRALADTGVSRLLWDGRNDNGQRSPAGTYYLRVEEGQDAVKLVILR